MKSRTNKNIDVITHTCARARGVHTLVSVAANDKEAKRSTVGTFILLGRRRAGPDEASGSDHPPVRWAFHPAVNQTSLWRMRAALT